MRSLFKKFYTFLFFQFFLLVFAHVVFYFFQKLNLNYLVQLLLIIDFELGPENTFSERFRSNELLKGKFHHLRGFWPVEWFLLIFN